MNDEIKAGSELYKVYNDSRAGRNGTVVVKSVGPKWITMDGFRGERFDKATLRAEGGSSRLYLSKDIHDAEVARSSAWERLRRILDRHTPPEDLSTEAMLQAIDLLTAKKQAETGGNS
ncbi:hypothetical protein D3C71_156770 [compost metagenome]